VSEKPDLLDVLDTAAAQLLARAGLGGSLSEEESKNLPDLAEQCKVFSAVMTWMDKRADLKPPEKRESQFDAIREKFHSASAPDRGASGKRAKKSPAIGAPAGADSADEVRHDA
jgi:hypothetical protein